MKAPSRGFSWGPAAVSTSLWAGIPLHALLKLCGVTMEHVLNEGEGKYVCFSGPENELGKGVYGTSIPLAKAMDPSADVLVAYEQNGKLLTPDHGFPIRMIIPGYIGGRMIKWLEKIEITENESQSW